MKNIDLIIPAYNEEAALPHLYNELKKLANEENSYNFQFIFIDDGSDDNSLEYIKKTLEFDNRIKYLSFSRNFGKEAAILAGLEYSTGDAVAILDADMQHPPSLLKNMINSLNQNQDYDIVAAKRINRTNNSFFYTLGTKVFYWLNNKLSDINMPQGAQDFCIMKRKVVDAILSLKEYNRFSKGIFSWIGFNTKWIDHEDSERIAGKTKWSFISSSRYAIEGIVAFSTKPLTIMFLFGLIVSFTGFIYALYVIITTLIGKFTTPGFPTLVSLILIFSGIIISSLGLVGLYIARIYTEVKNRPIYLLKDTNMEKNID